MLQKLKKTALGKALYRVSRSAGGGPLRTLAKILQHEVLNTAHWKRANRSHNQEQTNILARFESAMETRR